MGVLECGEEECAELVRTLEEDVLPCERIGGQESAQISDDGLEEGNELVLCHTGMRITSGFGICEGSQLVEFELPDVPDGPIGHVIEAHQDHSVQSVYKGETPSVHAALRPTLSNARRLAV